MGPKEKLIVHTSEETREATYIRNDDAQGIPGKWSDRMPDHNHDQVEIGYIGAGGWEGLGSGQGDG